MTIVVAVAAFDPAPVARLGALTSGMALFVAVAALHDTGLVAVAGHVAFFTTVVTGTSATAATSTGTRLGAIGLAVPGESY